MQFATLPVERFQRGGFIIYPRGTMGGQAIYLFNRVIGATPDITFQDNYNKTTLRTFGKYPSIFYVGNTNFRTFSLQTVFTTEEISFYYNSDLRDFDSLTFTIPVWDPHTVWNTGTIVRRFFSIAIGWQFFRAVTTSQGQPPSVSANTPFWTFLAGTQPFVTPEIRCQDADIITFTAYDFFIEFKRQVEQRIPWVARGSVSGEDFIVDLEITSTIYNQNSIIRKGGIMGHRLASRWGKPPALVGPDDSPVFPTIGSPPNVQSFPGTGGDMFFSDYIQVSVNCTEIDDYIYPSVGVAGDGPEDRFNIWGGES